MEVNTEGYHLDWSHAINLSSTLSLSDYHNHFLARSKSIYIIVNSQDIQVTAGLAQLKTDKLPQKVHHLLGWLGSSQCYKMAIYCTQGRCHTCPDMYKVKGQNHRGRQFLGGSIPLSVRHKHNSCLLFAPVGSSGHQRTQWIKLLLVECNVHSPQVCDVLKNFHF